MKVSERGEHPRPKKGVETFFRVTRYRDNNPRVYKSVPLALTGDWPRDLNYSARETGGRASWRPSPLTRRALLRVAADPAVE